MWSQQSMETLVPFHVGLAEVKNVLELEQHLV